MKSQLFRPGPRSEEPNASWGDWTFGGFLGLGGIMGKPAGKTGLSSLDKDAQRELGQRREAVLGVGSKAIKRFVPLDEAGTPITGPMSLSNGDVIMPSKRGDYRFADPEDLITMAKIAEMHDERLDNYLVLALASDESAAIMCDTSVETLKSALKKGGSFRGDDDEFLNLSGMPSSIRHYGPARAALGRAKLRAFLAEHAIYINRAPELLALSGRKPNLQEQIFGRTPKDPENKSQHGTDVHGAISAFPEQKI
jgi:hypothetical protein